MATHDVRGWKDEAAALMARGKVPAALELWKKVAAATPDDIAALQKVGELQAKVGQKAEAVKTYELVAGQYAAKGQFFKASAVCRLVLGLEPGHQRTQELIATLYARDKATTPLTKPTRPAAAPVPVPVPVPAAAPAVEVELDISIELPAPPPEGLPAIPLFSMLTRDELKDVLNTSMELRAFGPGAVIVAEGAPGDSMFAVVEGEGRVYRGWGTPAQREVAQVATGDIFGEAAMVSGAARLATVVTVGDAVVIELTREAMGQVISRFPRVGQMIDEFYRERLLANVLRASPVLRLLPEASKRALSAQFQPCTFVDGQRIIAEGQPADSVHLLLRGVCAVSHSSGQRYPDLREGDLFGEVSVLTEGPATASVMALGPVLTLRLSGPAFTALVLSEPAARAAVNQLAAARLDRTGRLDEALHDARV